MKAYANPVGFDFVYVIIKATPPPPRIIFA
jgi:hypothetical protein